ncbi:MAG: hypothetical protein NTV07_04370 [Candidatus Omnitrophica bacterium]|nr:hypothetical protein [Candidatus Omnitrophota bacterium]
MKKAKRAKRTKLRARAPRAKRQEAAPGQQKVYINGKLIEKDNAKITVFDHGLLWTAYLRESVFMTGSYSS